MQPSPDTNRTALNSSAVSDRGLSEKRPQNEDSYLEMPQIGIFAVADGVGGAEAGEVASQMAVEILGEAFTNRTSGSDAEMVMRIALERANAAIHQMSNDLSQLSKMATTIVALHLDGTVATIGHAGDSRLYRSSPYGTLVRETEDHSMVADEVRAGRMTEEQAETHPGKNIINRALGAEPQVEVELKTIMIDDGSTFLLCSDGITRHISDEELTEILASGAEPATICSHLKELCFERGAEDNLTAVVVRNSVASQPVEAITPVAAEPEFDILALPDSEEDTIATARFAAPTEDDLLEIETSPLIMPVATESEIVEEAIVEAEPIEADAPSPFADTLQMPETEPETAPEPIQVQIESTPEPRVPATPEPTRPEPAPFSIEQDEPSSLGRLAAYAAVLVLGSVIGLAVYHFAFRPPTPPPATDQLTGMGSDNVAVSAFEDNRRAVEADP
ncbi:MAG TPA: protein phosphatase 2C domain-containing protein, partial [Pyrinomonadaceae bacterium]|nr:protein phosphatase 2C domain-containing protein [Pyrinomonadaceae bacterium]